MRNMRTMWLAGAALLLALMWAGGMAWAAKGGGNPHLIGNQFKTAIENNGDLEITFKVAGLGNIVGEGETVTVTFTATAVSDWVCTTKGGSCPAAANKKLDEQEVAASRPFTVDKNGAVSGSLTAILTPPSTEETGIKCGAGQIFSLDFISYEGMKITLTVGEGTPTVIAEFELGDLERDFALCTKGKK